ncbi:hypothetical protein AB0L65_58855 [Nonomuraea sp. NPDC052116]|uniref:hypothetical protein n=1 Tax=Nonomuraea sp. NPDC052116 TaxID=3155665 RepID=UPI00342AA9D2
MEPVGRLAPEIDPGPRGPRTSDRRASWWISPRHPPDSPVVADVRLWLFQIGFVIVGGYLFAEKAPK